MSSERLDKQWKKNGLTGYSTAAILGTLRHYGAPIGEGGLDASSTELLPTELAETWLSRWKGTGQFQDLPLHAADELVRRLAPHKSTPLQTAHLVIEAARQLTALQVGKPETSADAFTALEHVKAKLPDDAARRERFSDELGLLLESLRYETLIRELVAAEKAEPARRFAVALEQLFPDREGTLTALVDLAGPNRAPTLTALTSWAQDGSRRLGQRYAALTSLFDAGAYAELKQAGLGLFDACAHAGEWGNADQIAHLLAAALENSHESQGPYFEEVLQRVQLAHRHGGGHHH